MNTRRLAPKAKERTVCNKLLKFLRDYEHEVGLLITEVRLKRSIKLESMTLTDRSKENWVTITPPNYPAKWQSTSGKLSMIRSLISQ